MNKVHINGEARLETRLLYHSIHFFYFHQLSQIEIASRMIQAQNLQQDVGQLAANYGYRRKLSYDNAL
jgi:hypothetical protein